MKIRQAGLTAVWIAVATLFLAACGGNDAQQRVAFTEFLQTRILDKPGIRVPRLTDEERKQFGPYADHYAVIADFNQTMNRSVSPKLTAAVKAGLISSIQDTVTQRARLETARTAINAMGAALTEAQAQADAARAKLDQPDDLKLVYGKAYDRLVTQPATVFKDVVPVMDAVAGEAIDLGRYLEENRASVQVSGSIVETNDPAIQSAINEKLQSLQAKQQALRTAQTRMQAVAYGK